MFKLADVPTNVEYTDKTLADALLQVVEYTYGDRFGMFGYDIADIPAEGATDVGVTSVKETVLTTIPDATMFVTDFATGKLGVIPFTETEAAFVSGNQTIMSMIADILGYDDYVVFTYVTLTEGKRNRIVYGDAYCEWATGTNYLGLKTVVDTGLARGIWVADPMQPKLFRPFASEGFFGFEQVAGNGVMHENNFTLRVPLEFYLTDMQNIQDMAKFTLLSNKADSDAADAALALAMGNAAEMIGSLSVFGNTVKDVAQRYNTISQYIPRP